MTVTLDSMKAHLGVTEDHDDTLIAEKTAVATAFIEAQIGKPFADFDPVPTPLLEAVRQVAAHLYENREATIIDASVREVPFGVEQLIGPNVDWVV